MNFDKLTDFQLDVLREVGNIGAGNAATALSQLLNRKVDMVLPSVNIVSFDDMMDLLGGPDETIVAILFRIYGDAPGNVVFVLSVEEAEMIVRKMTNNPSFSLESEYTPLDISVLEEIGNIVTGSYISALSDFTQLNLQPSVPHLGIDMAGAVITYGLIDISQVSDYAIVIDSKVDSNTKNSPVKGNFFLLPNPESLKVIFQALGIVDHE